MAEQPRSRTRRRGGSDPVAIREQYNRRKAGAVMLLGGKCATCGAVDDLESDHIDPSAKEFNITDALGTWAVARILSELAKCQLLCARCHKQKTLLLRFGIKPLSKANVTISDKPDSRGYYRIRWGQAGDRKEARRRNREDAYRLIDGL